MITESDFTRLYAWTMGQHDGFTCPFCKQRVPPGEKHMVHLTTRDTYAFCDHSPKLEFAGGNDGNQV